MRRSKRFASLMILGAFFSSSAAALDINLCAGAYDAPLDDAERVRMWGYSLGVPDSNGLCEGLSSPGPQIVLPVGDSILNVTLHNTLSVPTSLVMPGTLSKMTPVMFVDAQDRQRVRSFTHEAAAAGSAVYRWNNLKPGTYLYHSGTNLALQVQMGLAGAMTHDVAVNTTYDNRLYDHEVVALYSEIDLALHRSVARGVNYDERDGQSIIASQADLFRVTVNGIYRKEAEPLELGRSGDVILLRFLNVGQSSRVPTALNSHFELLAEDAKAYPTVRKQHSMLLPALKTRDALLKIEDPDGSGGEYSVYDGSMALSTLVEVEGEAVAAAAAEGNQISGDSLRLIISLKPRPDYEAPEVSESTPVAWRDKLTVSEGGGIAHLLRDAVSNDWRNGLVKVEIVSAPKQGELLLNGVNDVNLNGYEGLGYRYQHNGGEVARDSLVYALVNVATGERSVAGISIDVTSINDPPVAVNDAMTVTTGQTVELRVLENDSDAEDYSLSIGDVSESQLGNGVNLLDKALVYEVVTAGTDLLTYTVVDVDGATAQAQVEVTAIAATNGSSPFVSQTAEASAVVAPLQVAPTAVADNYSVMQGKALTVAGILGLLANDSSGSVLNTTLLVYPQHGAITLNADGSFVYQHDGSATLLDRFEYEVYNDFGTAKAWVDIVITALSLPPKVVNDVATTTVNQAVVINVVANDVDNDSPLNMAADAIVLFGNQWPRNGVVTTEANGLVTYMPNLGFTGQDKFFYQLKDSVTGQVDNNDAKVTVTIN